MAEQGDLREFQHGDLVADGFPGLFPQQPDRVAGHRRDHDLLVAAAAGYAFSRFDFRGKRLIIALMLITQMFPLLMIIAPIYKIVAAMGLLNSLTSLIIVYTAFNIPFATFLMQSFFDGIPKDLEEAAMIDGCTRFEACARSSCR